MQPDIRYQWHRPKLGASLDDLRRSPSCPGAAGHCGPPDLTRSPGITYDRATRHVTCRLADPCLYAPPAVRQGNRRRRLGKASAGDLDVFRLGPLLALGDVELDLLSFLQAAVAITSDCAEMHEHVLAALDRDEAIAFVAVEP